jgi:hypothetical protein
MAAIDPADTLAGSGVGDQCVPASYVIDNAVDVTFHAAGPFAPTSRSSATSPGGTTAAFVVVEVVATEGPPPDDEVFGCSMWPRPVAHPADSDTTATADTAASRVIRPVIAAQS